MADLVPVKDLVRDEKLYPREELNWANVERLVQVLRLNGDFPPIIAWRENSKVIDGFHRIQAAIWAEGGNDAVVEVEWRDYASEAEAFEDAVRLNAAHGLRLGSRDYGLIRQRAEELGITDTQVSKVLKVPMSAFKRQVSRVQKGGGSNDYAPSTAGKVRLSVEHSHALGAVVRDLEPRLAEGREEGPGNLPERMSEIQEARKAKDNEALRAALLDTAALFVWWAARLQLPARTAA